MDELDDARAFADGLKSPAKPAVLPPSPAPAVPEIDAGVAHLAATLTELKVSTQRLHADLAQRLRGLEAKVDKGLPDWTQLSQAVVRAGEEAGRRATDNLAASTRILVEEGKALNARRAEDLRLIWWVVNWVALPIALLAAGGICWLAWKLDTVRPAWVVVVAIGLGVLLAILVANLRDVVREKLRTRSNPQSQR
jgi:hypothetical protein